MSRSLRFEDPVTSIAREEYVSVHGLTRSAVYWDPNHPIRRRKYSSRVLPYPSFRSWASSGHHSQRSALPADAAKEREPLGIDHESQHDLPSVMDDPARPTCTSVHCSVAIVCRAHAPGHARRRNPIKRL